MLWLLMLHDGFGASLPLKKPLGLFLDGLLPLTDLNRVNTVLLPYLIDRLHAFEGFKTNLGLKLRAVDLTFLLIHKLFLIIYGNSLNYCPKYGDHYIFAGLFPSQPVQKASSLDDLKKQVARLLRQKWGQGVELKESFKEEADKVVFSLRFKTHNYAWQTLLKLEGQRLKPTRLQAYKALLAQLEAGKDPSANAAPLTPVAPKRKQIYLAKLHWCE